MYERSVKFLMLVQTVLRPREAFDIYHLSVAQYFSYHIDIRFNYQIQRLLKIDCTSKFRVNVVKAC